MKFINNGCDRCPYAKCQNRTYREPDDVKLHLYQNNFVKEYWYWTSHGETEPTEYGNVGNSNAQNFYEHMVPSDMGNTEPFVDRVGAVVNDGTVTIEVNVNEQPNAEVQTFYNMLQAAQRPLLDGCTNQTELSNAVRLTSIKSDYNMPQNCFNKVMQLMHESCLLGNRVLKNNSKLKRKV